MSEGLRTQREKILIAGQKAVDELIKVLGQNIITADTTDLGADKMKNAAAAKRLAFEDALSINEQIEKERNKFDNGPEKVVDLGSKGFAEGRTKASGK
jgi:hypothetical protein